MTLACVISNNMTVLAV